MTFVEDDSQEQTTFEFISESPFLQYNFVVRGKEVGKIMQHMDMPNQATKAF